MTAADRIDPLGPDETVVADSDGRLEVTFDLPMPAMSFLTFTPA